MRHGKSCRHVSTLFRRRFYFCPSPAGNQDKTKSNGDVRHEYASWLGETGDHDEQTPREGEKLGRNDHVRRSRSSRRFAPLQCDGFELHRTQGLVRFPVGLTQSLVFEIYVYIFFVCVCMFVRRASHVILFLCVHLTIG